MKYLRAGFIIIILKMSGGEGMEAYVKLEDVTKVYHMGEVEIRAADGINFEIMKGEFVVIVGPSGAGKTTVLNVLGGMDTATSGFHHGGWKGYFIL